VLASASDHLTDNLAVGDGQVAVVEPTNHTNFANGTDTIDDHDGRRQCFHGMFCPSFDQVTELPAIISQFPLVVSASIITELPFTLMILLALAAPLSILSS
jgi:hypothetical protein